MHRNLPPRMPLFAAPTIRNTPSMRIHHSRLQSSFAGTQPLSTQPRRRFCQGMLINLHLMSRHDLLALTSYAITPSEDHIIIEVSMHAASMPPTVLAVAPSKQLRTLQKDCRDIDTYAHPVNPTAAGLKKWPDLLQVSAESAAVFADLFPSAVTDTVFSTPVRTSSPLPAAPPPSHTPMQTHPPLQL